MKYLGLLLLAAACGGQVEVREDTSSLEVVCRTEAGSVACADQNFYVFDDTTSTMDQCRSARCEVGMRCAIIATTGVSYGTCH